jgi:hypothetical protein
MPIANFVLKQDLIFASNGVNLQTASKHHSLTHVYSFTFNYNMAHYNQKCVYVCVCVCVGLRLLAPRKQASEKFVKITHT